MNAASTLLPWAGDVGATLVRLLAGVAVAIALGWPLGILLGRKVRLWRWIEPSVELVRAVPPALAFPLALLLLGYGELARVTTVTFGTVALFVVHVAGALERAPAARRDIVALAGVRGIDAIRVLDVHESMPALLLALRLALAQGLIIAVVGEMLVGTRHGLGARAMDALVAYDVADLMVVLVVSGLLGAGLSTIVAALERRFVSWARD